jgi:hypothetical protein
MTLPVTLEGVVGSTWVVVVKSVKLDGVEVSEATLGACTISGRVGGIATTSSEIDPEPGVRARVRVSAAASAAAVSAAKPILSQIDITFASGDKLPYQFLFKVLPAAS